MSEAATAAGVDTSGALPKNVIAMGRQDEVGRLVWTGPVAVLPSDCGAVVVDCCGCGC